LDVGKFLNGTIARGFRRGFKQKSETEIFGLADAGEMRFSSKSPLEFSAQNGLAYADRASVDSKNHGVVTE
jgi:hypothetical protein